MDTSAVETIISTTTAEGWLKEEAMGDLPWEQYPEEARLEGETVKRLAPNVLVCHDNLRLFQVKNWQTSLFMAVFSRIVYHLS